MTADEKKQMLTVVRVLESLLSENTALKEILLAHRIPERVWARKCDALVNDPDFAGQVHEILLPHGAIESSVDLSKVLESLLPRLGKTGRVH